MCVWGGGGGIINIPTPYISSVEVVFGGGGMMGGGKCGFADLSIVVPYCQVSQL